MPDSPVEWQLLGNEMQLLNDISSFLNLRNREKVRVGMYVCVGVCEREISGDGKRVRAQRDHVRWTSREKVGRPPAVSPLGGSSS